MFGPCSFAVRDQTGDTYITKYVEICCLVPDEYTLTCRDSEHIGWRGGFLSILGQKHCYGFVGYTSRQKLTIVGMHVCKKLTLFTRGMETDYE